MVNFDHLRRVVGGTPDPDGAPAKQRIGKYEIERELARGGMGVVYRAVDTELRRPVALKVLLETSTTAEDAMRLYQEARAAARLRHPNIVAVYDVGEAADQHYIAMELVEGRTLRDARLPLRRSVEILEQVARAVHHAHEQGIVHRDLKPDNVLIDGTGRPLVADFGLARIGGASVRLTRSGDLVGTPLYMSPEQVRGEGSKVGPRADVYALGVMLYEILAGVPPFDGATLEEVCLKIAAEEAPPPSSRRANVDRDLETTAMKAMASEPVRRYGSARLLADDLGRWLRGEPILARPVSTLGRISRRVRRYPVASALAGGAIVAALAGVYFAWASSVANVRLDETTQNVEHLAREAVGAYENALTDAPAPLTDERRALESTRKLLERIYSDRPRSHELLIYIGRIHALAGDYARALERMNEGIARLGARAQSIHYLQRGLVRVDALLDWRVVGHAMDNGRWPARCAVDMKAAGEDFAEARRRAASPTAGSSRASGRAASSRRTSTPASTSPATSASTTASSSSAAWRTS